MALSLRVGVIYFKYLIDRKNKRGSTFYTAACSGKDKTLFLVYYEKLINFFSLTTKKTLSYFVDTEKGKVFAEDLLAPLKVHSMLGVPMDHRVSFENNTDHAIGDIVEHTSFYGIKPLDVTIYLFSSIIPNYTKY